MHKCIQLYVILEVCIFGGTLACHFPSFQLVGTDAERELFFVIGYGIILSP